MFVFGGALWCFCGVPGPVKRGSRPGTPRSGEVVHWCGDRGADHVGGVEFEDGAVCGELVEGDGADAGEFAAGGFVSVSGASGDVGDAESLVVGDVSEDVRGPLGGGVLLHAPTLRLF